MLWNKSSVFVLQFENCEIRIKYLRRIIRLCCWGDFCLFTPSNTVPLFCCQHSFSPVSSFNLCFREGNSFYRGILACTPNSCCLHKTQLHIVFALFQPAYFQTNFFCHVDYVTQSAHQKVLFCTFPCL